MVDKLVSIDKSNGVYYTPSELADVLVAPLLNGHNCTIFDPAYGEGSLLLAAERLLTIVSNSYKSEDQLFGCDLHPVNGLLEHIQQANLVELDYFDYPTSNIFDIILMNPPFVRHHLIEMKKKNEYREKVAHLLELKGTCDLWAYFLVKSLDHMKKGGSIGAILPWSFLQADYAQPVRVWLSKHFKEIKIHALGAKYFKKAKERIVLVWLMNYGTHCSSIKITSSKKTNIRLRYTSYSQAEWKSDRVVLKEGISSSEILSRYAKEYLYSRFENYAKIKIGVVTGADNYFIISQSDFEAELEAWDYLVPLYNTSKDIRGLWSNEQSPSRSVLTMTEANKEIFKEYIKRGEQIGYQFRAHSKRRRPWYAVDIGRTPDAFFPYRTSIIPYLVMNDQRVQCTNSIHRVYFDGLSDTEIKWIQVSILSVASQLSLESGSKTYGRSILKVEPKSLKNCLVYKSNSKKINAVYQAVNQLLLKSDKVGAMDLSTNFIDETLGVPKDLSNAARSCLIGIQSRRLDR